MSAIVPALTKGDSMFSKLLFMVLTVVASLSMANIKMPGTILASTCGQNQIKLNAAGVTQVCTASVTGLADSKFLIVTVKGGIAGGTYVYEYTKRFTAVAECQQTAKGLACIKSYSLVGTVGAQSMFERYVSGSLETVTVFTTNNGQTVKGSFLGNDFETNPKRLGDKKETNNN